MYSRLMDGNQEIARTWVVGTDPSCDVRVDDQYASNRHCQVAVTTTGTYMVKDLGSMNGTRIRRMGQDVKVYFWTPILPGDILIVGRSQIPWSPDGGA